MAENESLDLGGAYAKRWDVPFDAVQKGASGKDVARTIERALYPGLRRALKQLNEYGVTLSDLLAQRHSRHAMQQLIRKTQGHEYVQLFDAAAAATGPSEGQCLRAWIDAILDKVSDQICHRVTGRENWATFYDVQAFMQQEVQRALEPVVDRIVTNFERDPSWQPKRAPIKGQEPANPTADLLGMSLLGAARP
jgi:hypothetical protein